MSALLVLDNARIESGGSAGEPLCARGGDTRLALVGNFRPLFRLLAGDARLVSGTAELAGESLSEAVRRGTAGLALLDPPLVPGWTLERYLFESASLAGLTKSDAQRAGEAALGYFELTGLRRTRLDTMFAPVRRATFIALATLAAPAVLCVEAPLSDLDADGQTYVARALERAAVGRRLLVSVPTLLPEAAERELVARADWVVEEHAGRVVREGAKLERSTRRYLATVTRGGPAFLEALAARGLAARPTPLAPVRAGEPTPNDGGQLRVVIEVPATASTREVLSAAEAAGAPLVELSAV